MPARAQAHRGPDLRRWHCQHELPIDDGPPPQPGRPQHRKGRRPTARHDALDRQEQAGRSDPQLILHRWSITRPLRWPFSLAVGPVGRRYTATFALMARGDLSVQRELPDTINLIAAHAIWASDGGQFNA